MASEGRKDRQVGSGEDPERLLIAAELAETPLSAAQLAEATGISLARVRRHVREMREEGLLESVMRESKRGTVEHFNLLIGGLMLDADELSGLSLEERRRVNGKILKVILTEASRALVTHPTTRSLERTDDMNARIPIFTDEKGWKELARLHQEFYEQILAVREQIEKRLEKEGKEGFKTSSVLLFFESETTD
jgi:DNA-binding transcriptional ArsR family regulator